MKKLLLLLTAFSTLSLTNVSAQFQGTFGMGAHTTFGIEHHNLGAGLHIHYYATNNIKLVPSATFFLPQNNISMWKAEFDIHVVAPISFSSMVYPIAGVSFTNRRFEAPSTVDTPNWTSQQLGGNFGVGFQHDIMYRLRWTLEVKYHIVRDRSQVGIMAGIGFWI